MIGAGSSARRDELKIMASVPGILQVGLWNNVSLTAWCGKATLPAAQELVKVTERTVALLGAQRFSAIHLLVDKVDLPGSDVRDVLLRFIKDYNEQIACTAVILNGTGFWASAVRSFITGMLVLAPRTFDLRVFGKPAELLAWLPPEHLKRTGVDLDLATLGRMLELAKTWQQTR